MTCGIGNYSLEKSRDGVIQHPEPEDTTFHPLIDGWTGERYTAFPERDLRGFKAEGPPMHLKYIEINVINPLGKAKYPTQRETEETSRTSFQSTLRYIEALPQEQWVT